MSRSVSPQLGVSSRGPHCQLSLQLHVNSVSRRSPERSRGDAFTWWLTPPMAHDLAWPARDGDLAPAPPPTAGGPRPKAPSFPALATSRPSHLQPERGHPIRPNVAVKVRVVRCLWCGVSGPSRYRWSSFGTRQRAGLYRPLRHARADHRPLRRTLVHRGAIEKRQTDRRGRPGPQPRPACRQAHRPLRVGDQLAGSHRGIGTRPNHRRSSTSSPSSTE